MGRSCTFFLKCAGGGGGGVSLIVADLLYESTYKTVASAGFF